MYRGPAKELKALITLTSEIGTPEEVKIVTVVRRNLGTGVFE